MAAPVPLYLMFTALLAGFLAMHVKDQFAESRAHLMPDFRRIHIVAAATATMMLAVVAPGVVTWLVGVQSVGLIAVTLFVFGAMFWSVLVLSNWLLWPILALVLFSVPDARETLALLVTPQFEAQAVGLLALGVAIVVLAGVRLFRLNEDMPEYHRRMPTGWAAKGRMTGQNVNYDVPLPHTLVDWFREQAMANVTRHVRYAAHVAVVANLPVAGGDAHGLAGLALGPVSARLFPILGLVSSAAHAWDHSGQHGNKRDGGQLVCFPADGANHASIGGLVGDANAHMGYEVMLPVDRRSYVRQLIAALAISYFQFCGVILASTVLWCLVGVARRPPLRYVGSLAAAALLTQICQFGVMVFAYTVTSLRIVHVAALMVPMFGSVMLIITGGDAHANFQLLPEVLPIAAGSAALGTLLAYIAYRRWLVADFN